MVYYDGRYKRIFNLIFVLYIYKKRNFLIGIFFMIYFPPPSRSPIDFSRHFSPLMLFNGHDRRRVSCAISPFGRWILATWIMTRRETHFYILICFGDGNALVIIMTMACHHQCSVRRTGLDNFVLNTTRKWLKSMCDVRDYYYYYYDRAIFLK